MSPDCQLELTDLQSSDATRDAFRDTTLRLSSCNICQSILWQCSCSNKHVWKHLWKLS